MKSVVITGSTRGIGYGLASSFLERGCSVVVSGRNRMDVDHAVETLRKSGQDRIVYGHPCDVREPNQLQALWQAAQRDLDRIDIWINNAGVNGSPQSIWENSEAEAAQVVDTNIKGVVFGSQIAMKGMLEQGHGSIYNMEGMGSGGDVREGMILYGMTKCAVAYFTKGLVKEAAGKPIIVGSIRPGMVITDMITESFRGRPQEWERVRRIFNIIADRVETVTPWLADRILANSKRGACIAWTSRTRLMLRFLSAPFSKRDILADVDID